MKGPILIVSGSTYLESSSSLSQKNLNPPSPPLLTHLKAMSTLSPSQECKQLRGFTRFMTGGSLLALRGTLNEFSSVTTVRTSSKSAKLGAVKDMNKITLIPGAISPITLLGYLTFLTVKLSLKWSRGVKVPGRRNEFDSSNDAS